MKRRRNILIMLGPSVFILALISLYPFFFSIYLSTTNASLSNIKGFIGFSNYIELFKDPRFYNSLKLCLIFIIGATIIQLFIGFLLALLLNRDSLISKLSRLLLVIPMMVTPIVVGITWRFLYDADYGLINYILGLIGIHNVPWLINPNIALLTLILIDSWQWTPFMMLTILAGLRSLPIEPYEAASIDGASKFQGFRYITLPLLIPVVLVALLIRTIDAFKAFDIFFATTLGGPGTATEILSLFIYKTGFRYSHMGSAAALSIIMLIIIIIICNFYIRVMKRTGNY